jgi:hypothetical protein
MLLKGIDGRQPLRSITTKYLWHTPCHGYAHATLINLSTLDREAPQDLVVAQLSELGAQQEKLLSRDNEIEHLKLVIARLRRMIARGPRTISSPTPMPVARCCHNLKPYLNPRPRPPSRQQ